MGNLTADGTAWVAGVYQLERSDAVDAGTGGNGVSNQQAKNLADRTEYLKIHTDALEVLRERGSVQRSVVVLVANTTLVRATHIGTLIENSGNVITMPPTTGLVEGDPFAFKAGLTAAVTIQKNTAQTIPEAVLYGFAADTIVLQPGEQLVLIWKSGVWRILSYSQVSISSPTGSVVSMAGSTVPTGWLKCNGASLLRTAYARLFAAIGTTYGSADSTHFNLPDLRGEFIRGWDDARGVDTGRTIGSGQGDDFKAHTHTFNRDTTGAGGTGGDTGNSSTGTRVTNSTGGAETRPRNVALMYCIKF